MIKNNWQTLIKPHKLNVKSTDNERRNLVVAEPLERGYALTLGTALRRIMLSSLQGAAVTGIKIEGVQHEFSTIPGIIEDLTGIILNIKGLALKKHSDTPRKMTLIVDKEGPVTADQLQSSSDVEILNPDYVICHVDNGGKINMELTVETGKGYIPASQLRRDDTPIGYIPIDAIFNPVKSVAVKVENTRVGQQTDYDKLILDVETNGSVLPENAVAIAARILQDQLKQFITFDEPIAEVNKKEEDSKLPFDRNFLRKVDELELSVRSANCLLSDNIVYIGDLVLKTEQGLLRTPNFGRKSLNEITEVLKQMDLKLGMQIPDWPPENIEDLAKKIDEPY